MDERHSQAFLLYQPWSFQIWESFSRSFLLCVLNSFSLWWNTEWFRTDQGDLCHESWWNWSSNRWGSRPRDNLAPHTIFPWLKGPCLSFHQHSQLTGDFPWEILGTLCIRKYTHPFILFMLETWNPLLIFFEIYHFKSFSKSCQCFHFTILLCLLNPHCSFPNQYH